MTALPRVHCASGRHRSPTVALLLAGLLEYELHIASVDVFPVTLAQLSQPSGSRRKQTEWDDEAARLAAFLMSGSKLSAR